jgi:hypothetical protein
MSTYNQQLKSLALQHLNYNSGCFESPLTFPGKSINITYDSVQATFIEEISTTVKCLKSSLQYSNGEIWYLIDTEPFEIPTKDCKNLLASRILISFLFAGDTIDGEFVLKANQDKSITIMITPVVAGNENYYYEIELESINLI